MKKRLDCLADARNDSNNVVGLKPKPTIFSLAMTVTSCSHTEPSGEVSVSKNIATNFFRQGTKCPQTYENRIFCEKLFPHQRDIRRISSF